MTQKTIPYITAVFFLYFYGLTFSTHSVILCVDKINLYAAGGFSTGGTALKNDIIKKIRQFNRCYTVWLNVMNKSYLGTDFSWPESRVLFEIYLCQGITATKICEALNMDKSYVSRILGKFERQGLITREVVPGSKGTKKLRLTNTGRKEAEIIDLNGDRQISDKLKAMDDTTLEKLCDAMTFIEKTLGGNDLHRLNRPEE